MANFVLLDEEGIRFGEFEAPDRWQAWGIAIRLARYPRPRPRTWSLLIEKDAGLAYMGGVGFQPKRAEVKRP
jgi:hypothetical protein